MRIGLDISVLNTPHKTGIGLYTFNVIDNLLRLNKKDSFVLFGISTFATFDYLNNIKFRKYPNVELIVKKMPAKFFRVSFLMWQKLNFPPIEKFIGEVDVYHSFNWYFPPQQKGKKVASVFDMTSQIFPQWHHQRTTQLDKIRFVRIKDQADLVITISENSKKDFLKYSPQSKVEVIYPAGNITNRKIEALKIKNILKKYKISNAYYLSVATLEPRKNLVNLIKAYLKANLEKPLVLVGLAGWKSKEIQETIKGKNQIIMLNYISDEELQVLYSQAQCLIYPSFYEGFGIPVLEALSLGTPVICSQTSSLPEVAGEAALYIEPSSIDSIAKAIVNIDKDEKLRQVLIKKGLHQAKKFSWVKSANKLNDLYHQL